MKREQYEYDNNLSDEANQKLKVHHEIYEDVLMIVHDEHAINNVFGVKSKTVSNNQLEELKTYAEQYLNETNCGILRTVIKKMTNIDLIITDFYCNGFAGRRCDLEGSVI